MLLRNGVQTAVCKESAQKAEEFLAGIAPSTALSSQPRQRARKSLQPAGVRETPVKRTGGGGSIRNHRCRGRCCGRGGSAAFTHAYRVQE